MAKLQVSPRGDTGSILEFSKGDIWYYDRIEGGYFNRNGVRNAEIRTGGMINENSGPKQGRLSVERGTAVSFYLSVALLAAAVPSRF